MANVTTGIAIESGDGTGETFKNKTALRQSATTMRINRELEKMDLDGDGEISKQELAAFLRSYVFYQDMATKTRTWLSFSIMAIILLAVSNIGTAYLAVYLAKDTSVSSSGSLVSKNSGEMVSTLGQGVTMPIEVTVNVEEPSTKDFCITLEDLALLWASVESGADVGLVASDSTDPGIKEMIHLEMQGSKLDSDTVCFNTSGEGTICVDFSDNSCAAEDSRRLMENGNNDVTVYRNELFSTHVDSLRSGIKVDENVATRKLKRYYGLASDFGPYRDIDYRLMGDDRHHGRYFVK